MGTDRDFEQLVALVAAGQLRPRIDSVLPLEQAAQAHHRMEHSEQLGKIVLQM
jgi:NADPH:quinone reductase-like Zn-dependent oxidoreductase